MPVPVPERASASAVSCHSRHSCHLMLRWTAALACRHQPIRFVSAINSTCLPYPTCACSRGLKPAIHPIMQRLQLQLQPWPCSQPIQPARDPKIPQKLPASPGQSSPVLAQPSRALRFRLSSRLSRSPGLSAGLALSPLKHLGYRPMGAAAEALHSQAARQLKYSGLVLPWNAPSPSAQGPYRLTSYIEGAP